jgi:sialate O-acetylesterase
MWLNMNNPRRQPGAGQHSDICGVDNEYSPAKAKIVKDKIIVWNDEVINPVAVRYAWENNPLRPNLYNKEGLPASPFRTSELY